MLVSAYVIVVRGSTVATESDMFAADDRITPTLMASPEPPAVYDPQVHDENH